VAGSDSGCVSASADDKARGASWRGHLKVHPAAELFPLMSEPELRELGEDIKANGLRLSIVLYKGKLLDGRNRLDAMESVGIKFGFHADASTKEFYYLHACDGSDVFDGGVGHINHFDGDPYDFVLPANLHRRHLTSEQKRELIAKVLKAKPEASSAAVAKKTKTAEKTVAKVRRKLESTSEIPKLEKTVGADGKSRAKPKRKSESKPIDPTLLAISRGAMGDACIVAALEAESRATGSAEISAEDRRAYYAETENPVIVDDRAVEILPPENQNSNPIWLAWSNATPAQRRDFVYLAQADIRRALDDLRQKEAAR